jgi:hypothetical protein
MKKVTFFLASIISLVVLFTITAFKAPKPGPSANGQGTILLNYMNGEPQHFSFHALTDADGNVSGSWESKSPGQDIRTHGTITCIKVLADGKTAVLSGVVTHIVGDGYPGLTTGTPIWFKVQDNGEGANSAGDTFTDYFFGLAGCVDYGGTPYPITGGNIQVKP